MNTTDLYLAWTDMRRRAPSRRSLLQLVAGSAIGAALVQTGAGDAEAACRKAGRTCDHKKKRCCKGMSCKRGRCACKNGKLACRGVCRNLRTDKNNCGACGRRCGSESGTACVDGLCVFTLGEQGAGAGRFDDPEGVAVDGNGRIYVADRDNERIQVFNPDGSLLRQFGRSGSQNGQFRQPHDVAVASNGDIYVADTGNHRIQQFSSVGTHLRSWGAFGSGPDQLDLPASIDVFEGLVAVVDFNNHRIQVFNLVGTPLTRFGSQGAGPGQFDFPRGVAFASGARIYVADPNNNRVQEFNRDGSVIRILDGLDSPSAIDVSENGDLFVADSRNDRILQLGPTGALKRTIGRSGAGPGQLESPRGVAVDRFGAVVTVADSGNDRIQQFFSVDPDPSPCGEDNRAGGAPVTREDQRHHEPLSPLPGPE